jgi:hypothetical protein
MDAVCTTDNRDDRFIMAAGYVFKYWPGDCSGGAQIRTHPPTARNAHSRGRRADMTFTVTVVAEPAGRGASNQASSEITSPDALLARPAGNCGVLRKLERAAGFLRGPVTSMRVVPTNFATPTVVRAAAL